MATLDPFLLGYRPRSGDVVVELGAGAEHHTPALADLVGREGLVVAVEAHPCSFADLTAAVAGRSNVRTVWAAIVARHGRAYLTDETDPVLNHVADDGIAVPALTLDDLTTEAGAFFLPAIDLLKLNIEGSEVDALTAGPRTLARTSFVVVACHDFLGTPTRDAVASLLRRAGFDVAGPDDPRHPWEADYLYGSRGDAGRTSPVTSHERADPGGDTTTASL